MGKRDNDDVDVLGPRGLRASTLVVDGLELAVLSSPLSTASFDGWSSAERALAIGILSGKSNASLARERGTSARTVANQLSALYRRLGINSRRELVAFLRGAR